tara:strand:+ start:288 stop:518 length:231 start_codon:yes stop_codon:yes gene_type:complete
MPSETDKQNVSMNVTDAENVVSEEAVTTKVKNVNVNINLLNNIKSILDISTARGTYRANELTSVGKVYDELVTLLK